MDLHVRPSDDGWRAVLDDGRAWPCVVGRGGVVPAARKGEGDGATPAGAWPVRALRYRPDRLTPPATGLPVRPLRPADGWCDDPDDPNYNQAVTLPFAAGHEALWRDDHLYDLVAMLGYNDDPPEAGKGSAIFLHLAPPDSGPTAGCVALARPALETVLSAMEPGSRVRIADT